MRTSRKYREMIQEDIKNGFDWLEKGEGWIFSLMLSFVMLGILVLLWEYKLKLILYLLHFF